MGIRGLGIWVGYGLGVLRRYINEAVTSYEYDHAFYRAPCGREAGLGARSQSIKFFLFLL